MGRSVKLTFNAEQIAQALNDEQDAALLVGASIVLDSAKAKAPRLSGELRESGYVATPSRSTYQPGNRRRKEVKKIKRGEAVVGFSAFYAGYVEVGTKTAAAKPYLRPALDESKEAATQAIGDALRQQLEARLK